MGTPEETKAAYGEFKARQAFDSYQAFAETVAVYPNRGGCLIYPVIGLVDEACEVAGALLTILTTQVTAADHAVVCALLAGMTDLGKAAGLVKKLYRDGGGTITAGLVTKLSTAARNVINDMEYLIAAVEAGGTVEMPPVALTSAAEQALVKELGDACWYVSQASTEVGVRLGHVFDLNADKLAGRSDRGTLHGSGDER